MKRSKRHRVKLEKPDTSTSKAPDPKEHDLAYYIHDRVELMHQVFSVLKSNELRTIAPECVRHISVNDLQELCMEELLGISSKRLCAILDGADPPSDTESSSDSSPDPLETISLDSISSDEEILSQISSKKSKKHKHHSKSKKKKTKVKEDEGESDKGQTEKSRRAGLTVLELLELQARARAIRAQLQQEQARAASENHPDPVADCDDDDDEVEIKEERAEVVEISSEDEKPNVQELEGRISASSKDASSSNNVSKTVTKVVKDLVITVPQAKSSRKIKLKRNTSFNTKTAEKSTEKDSIPITSKEVTSSKDVAKEIDKTNSNKLVTESSTKVGRSTEVGKSVKENLNGKDKGKSKEKKKKRKKDRKVDKDGSDHDEITLQLSDTEKMDLLEDLDEKKFQKSDTEDSSEDSDSDASDDSVKKSNRSKENPKLIADGKRHVTENAIELNKEVNSSDGRVVEVETTKNNDNDNMDIDNEKSLDTDKSNGSNLTQIITITETDSQDGDEGSRDKNMTQFESNNDNLNKSDKGVIDSVKYSKLDNQNICDKSTIEITSINDIPLRTDDEGVQHIEDKQLLEGQEAVNDNKELELQNATDNVSLNKGKDSQADFEISSEYCKNTDVDKHSTGSKVKSVKANSTEKSDGELSDRDSSEVEAVDLKSEVVCISDDDGNRERKKKKKEKKSKKEKKCKRKKDFRVSADQNFHKEININEPKPSGSSEVILTEKSESNLITAENGDRTANNQNDEATPKTNKIDDDDAKISQEAAIKVDTKSVIDGDVYEILELSDSSSCYEVEEITISKEPTAEEIQALSEKIDEIEQVKESREQVFEELEHVSWKDRYLKSTKVKKVLSTANILNAMRKKNLELKQKIQESKNIQEVETDKSTVGEEVVANMEEGSIEQYNTLEGSTKYVDPVKDTDKSEDDPKGTDKETVTKEMKKDAKQLLKMYKMLLKHNDMGKEKDPSKKRKKKKKSKDKEKSVASQASIAS